MRKFLLGVIVFTMACGSAEPRESFDVEVVCWGDQRVIITDTITGVMSVDKRNGEIVLYDAIWPSSNDELASYSGDCRTKRIKEFDPFGR